jgi:hypothetical protein
LESAEQNISLLVSTANTFQRIDKLGVISLLVKAAQLDVDTRILTSINTSTNKIMEKYGNESSQINFHALATYNRKFILILIVDESLSLVVDIKDDSQETFEDSIGIGTYSNIETTVETYISIFEKEWVHA